MHLEYLFVTMFRFHYCAEIVSFKINLISVKHIYDNPFPIRTQIDFSGASITSHIVEMYIAELSLRILDLSPGGRI
jgi:hypothetical protein